MAPLASVDSRPENIGVHPIITSELKLRDVERHIFGGHLVERPDHAAFEGRPEAFDGVGVDRASWQEALCCERRRLNVLRLAPDPDRPGHGPAESRAPLWVAPEWAGGAVARKLLALKAARRQCRLSSTARPASVAPRPARRAALRVRSPGRRPCR